MGTFTITQENYPRTVYYSPNANGHNNDFFTVGETDNYKAIDENIKNPDDSDYNYGYESSGEDFYEISDTSESGEIRYIRVHARIKIEETNINDIPNVYISITDNDGSNQYNKEIIALVDDFSNYSKAWHQNPRTSTNWTFSDIDNLEIGIVYSNASAISFNPIEVDRVELFESGTGSGVEIKNIIKMGDDKVVVLTYNKLSIYSWDGIDFALTAAYSNVSDFDFQDASVDGNYIFAAMGANGVGVFLWDGDSTISLVDHKNNLSGSGFAYSIYEGGTISLIDGTVVGLACGEDGVMLYLWDAGSLTYADTRDDGGIYFDVYFFDTGDAFFVTCGEDGLRKYSCAGGSISAPVEEVDSGGTYKGLDCDYKIGLGLLYLYVACGEDGLRAYTYDGTLSLVDTHDDGGDYHRLHYYDDKIVVAIYDITDNFFIYTFDGSDLIKVGEDDEALETRGIAIDEEYIYIANGSHINGLGFAAYRMYIPKIYVSHMFLELSYYITESVNLQKPEEISSDHARNIKMLNFWNGKREVYSTSRVSKTLVITGSDWSDDACEDIQTIRDMGMSGQNISISGLNMYIFNTSYKIRSFGWRQIQKSPIYYEWILELEFLE